MYLVSVSVLSLFRSCQLFFDGLRTRLFYDADAEPVRQAQGSSFNYSNSEEVVDEFVDGPG